MKSLEQLYYCTTRILVNDGNRLSTGTSFFIQLQINGKNYPLLVTNKHVLFNKNVCDYQIEIHTSLTSKKIIEETNGLWLFHKTEDIAFTFIAPVINKHLSKDEKITNIFLDESTFISDKDIKALDAIEEVIMVGYPKGIYDEVNNLPVIRRGIISSPLTIDYNGKKQGLVDICLFPGSSGSPIFVFKNYVGGDLNLKNDYFRLIGINFQGYSFKNNVIKAVNDTDSVETFVNLALYIKSECLLDFKEIILFFLNTNS